MPDAILKDANLAAVIGRIVDAYDPDRIYLFGSRARGQEHPWSDYDLLAVVPDETPRSKFHPVWVSENILNLPFPVDFFPCRRTAFEQAHGTVGTLTTVTMGEGRVIYERG